MNPDAASESSFYWVPSPSEQTPSEPEYSGWESPSFYAAQYWATDEFDDLWYCPCCYRGSPDSITADDHEARDEHLWQFEPYRDLRSAARGKNRFRTIRENKRSCCNSYRCRMDWQAEKRMKNKRDKREKYRHAVLDAKVEVPCYTRGCRRAKHNAVQWDVYLDEDFNEWVRSMADDLERYTYFRTEAEIFESREPYVEVGEDFATWCQRRIAEMRSVKEARLRAGESKIMKQRVWQSKIHPRNRRQYNIYIGDEKKTTLPTNAYDALGHESIRSILSLDRWWKKRARVSNASLFYGPNTYRWFGEYEWKWYQNESGCWEIGLGGYLNTECSTPCDYCDGLDANTDEGCYCYGRGKMPAPEEMQRCTLVEWLGKEGRDVMLEEEEIAMQWKVAVMSGKAVVGGGATIREGDKEVRVTTTSVDDAVEGCDLDGATWEMFSSTSSDTWSLVDVAF